MAMVGADVEQLNQLSAQLNNKANDIQSVISQLTSAINSVEWKGNDANRFRADWSGQYVGQLKQVVTALQTASQNAKRNAQEQQTASGN
ncbi:WXG100 family type VII secretion target [Mycolicibacterium fortuitum]|uniref:WXG100 family type VII secretion target n=1 Tax=Mycolicibacterium fortuitum TaxID=1766 RepID=UPI003AAA4169